MPAKSKKQLKLIWAIRNKYGSKSKAPKKWKWVFGEEWGHLETKIWNFKQFNENTLSESDSNFISDLSLEFIEDWGLLDYTEDTTNDSWRVFKTAPGKVSLVKGKKNNILSVILNGNVFNKNNQDNIEKDLNSLLLRIRKLGFNVDVTEWGGEVKMYFPDFSPCHLIYYNSNIWKNNITNESKGERGKRSVDLCWHHAKIGDILSEGEIYNYVQQIHRNEDDFWDGDLADRIENFSKYKLMEIPISEIDIDEWQLDIDEMLKFKKIYDETNDYPPIVLDGDRWEGYYGIIDGTHRVNALHRSGLGVVKAWVGIID